jgi:Photosystem I psaA/psaB protein
MVIGPFLRRESVLQLRNVARGPYESEARCTDRIRFEGTPAGYGEWCGGGSSAIRITTGIFSTWRAAGITCEHELFVTPIALLSLSALFILAGWYHHHVAVPIATWFNGLAA